MVTDALRNKKVEIVVGNSYSRAYYLIAYAYLELHDIQQADANLERGLQIEPDSIILLAEKGTLNQVAGKPEIAVTYFQKAIASKGCALDVETGKAYRGLGVSLIDLERLDEAEKALYTSLQYSPNNPGALNELHYIDRLRSGKQKQPLSTELQQVK